MKATVVHDVKHKLIHVHELTVIMDVAKSIVVQLFAVVIKVMGDMIV